MNQFLENLKNMSFSQRGGSIEITYMTPKIAYLLAANKVIRDETTKKFTFVDVFTAIAKQEGQSSLQTFHVAGRILGVESGVFMCNIKIIDPDNNILAAVPLAGNLLRGDVDINAFFGIVKFEKEGRYYFKVSVDDKDIDDDNRFYIDVVKLDLVKKEV